MQTAYEILSDPQERAWYDSHRDAILRGDDAARDNDSGPGEHYNVRITTTEELFALMGRFNSSVPCNDSPTGFFGILGVTFDQLALEEKAACEWEGHEPPEYPHFGVTGDSFDSVARPFYNAWSGFSTKKSFAWKDKYRLVDAPDRRVRRAMEKENKKARDEGIRDFNDAVRSLVAFVKKRDPRYIPNTQSEAERQRILRDSAALQAARSRAANQEKLADYVVPEWATSRGDDGGQAGEFPMSEEESEVEQIECVVCGKTFRSEKQFEVHEKSKKHIKAVQLLRRQMAKENDSFQLNSVQGSPTATLPAEDAPVREAAVRNPGLPGQSPSLGAAAPKAAGTPSTCSVTDDETSEYAPRDVVEGRIFPDRSSIDARNTISDEERSIVPEMGELRVASGPSTAKKMGKAKARREKKSARQAVGEQAGDMVGPPCTVDAVLAN